MKYRNIVKQRNPIAYQIIKNAITNNKVAHAYLFSAPKHVEILSEPLFLIQSLISEDPFGAEHLKPVLNYPDLIIVDGSTKKIKKEEITNAANRMSETALDEKGIKILLIKNIEQANVQSLNALLKFIEEPTPNTYIIMTTNNLSNVISTIKSRSQIINLKERSIDEFQKEIEEYGIPSKFSRIIAYIANSKTEAANIFEKQKIEEIYTDVIEALKNSLNNNQAIISDLSKKIKKDNYYLYFQLIKLFFADIWKYKENIQTSFKEEELIKRFIDNTKIDYSSIFNSINEFIMSQEIYSNFQLQKMNTLIKIGEAYE